MVLDILVLVLFVALIVYFVVTMFLIIRYKKMKNTTRFLINKYSNINKKSFVLDRYLSLLEINRVTLSEVYSSFMDLYAEVLDIDDEFRGDAI